MISELDPYSLSSLPMPELLALYHQVQMAFGAHDRNSEEFRAATSNIRIIQAEIAKRRVPEFHLRTCGPS